MAFSFDSGDGHIFILGRVVTHPSNGGSASHCAEKAVSLLARSSGNPRLVSCVWLSTIVRTRPTGSGSAGANPVDRLKQIASSAVIMGGNSGGPLVKLDGRLIGIGSRFLGGSQSYTAQSKDLSGGCI